MSARILGRNAASSMAQVVFSSLLLLVLYRVLIHYMSIADVGLWSLVIASTSLARLSEMGLGGGVVRFVATDLGRGDARKAASTVGMALVMVTGLICVAALALFPLFHAGLSKALQPDMLSKGLGLLPYAVIALVIGTVANMLLSAIDGTQRMDLRALIQLGSSVVQLIAALLLVPSRGVLSLGPVQVITACFTLFAAAVVAVAQLRQPPRAWLEWDGKRARELISYGGGLQVAAVGQLLFDPTVKMLLAYFGGLGFTGYYEMANRIIMQFRSIIVSAFNALIPYVAGRVGQTGENHDELRSIYIRSFKFLVVTAFAYYSLIGCALPFLLTIWLGYFEASFLSIALLCWLGWWVNTLVGPAYFLYLAVGRLRWAVTSQLAIGILNLILAWLLGLIFGGWGVLVGSVLGLALGSSVTLVAFQVEYKVHAKDIFPTEALILAFVAIAGAAISILLAYKYMTPHGPVLWLMVPPPILGLLLLLLLWRQPIYKALLQRLRLRRT